MGKFVIKAGKTGPYFVLKAGNGEIIGKSEIYSSKSACKNGIASVKKNAPDGDFEVYQDKAGEYRFRLRAKNGEPILASEGYTSKASCENGIDSVKRNADSEIVEE